jgi:hypothetical protein
MFKGDSGKMQSKAKWIVVSVDEHNMAVMSYQGLKDIFFGIH